MENPVFNDPHRLRLVSTAGEAKSILYILTGIIVIRVPTSPNRSDAYATRPAVGDSKRLAYSRVSLSFK